MRRNGPGWYWCLAVASLLLPGLGCGGKTDNEAVHGKWEIDITATRERFPDSAAGHDESLTMEFTNSGIMTMRRGNRQKVGSWREEMGKIVVVKDGATRRFDLIEGKVMVDNEGGKGDGAIFRKSDGRVADSGSNVTDSPPPISSTAPKGADIDMTSNQRRKTRPLISSNNRVVKPPTRTSSNNRPSVPAQETITLAKNESKRIGLDSHYHNAPLAFLPNGTRMFSVQDENLRVYDASDWSEEQPPMKIPARGAKGILVTPNSETVIVWGDSSNKATSFDVSSRNLLKTFAHDSAVNAAAVSSDGRLLVTAGSSSDRTVKIWDLSGGTELARYTRPGTEDCMAVGFNEDQTTVFVVDRAGLTKINVNDGKEQSRFEFGDRAYTAAMDPKGIQAVIGGSLWDVANGSQVKKFVDNSIFGSRILFAPKNDWVLIGQTNKKEVTIYSKESGSSLLTIGPHPDIITGVAFHPEGKTLVTSSLRALHVWRIPEPGSMSVAASSGGNSTPSGSPSEVEDNGRLQEVQLLQLPGRFFRGTGVKLSPDASFALVGNSKETAYFDIQSGGRLAVRKFEGQENAYSFDFTADGETAISGDRSGTVVVWNCVNGEKIKSLRGHDSAEIKVAIAPDGAYAATASTRHNGMLLVWDVEKNQAAKLIGHVKPLIGVKVLDQGRVISVSSTTIATWRAQNQKNGMTLNYAKKIAGVEGQCVDFSADGKYVLIGTRSGFQLWDILTKKKRISGRDVPNMYVEAVALSDNGRWGLISHNRNRELILWNFVANAEVDSIKVDMDVDHIDISYDGELAITVDGFGKVKTWKIPAKVREDTAVLPTEEKKEEKKE